MVVVVRTIAMDAVECEEGDCDVYVLSAGSECVDSLDAAGDPTDQ